MQPDGRAFEPGSHPHVPAGSSSGGEFAPKATSSQKPAAKHQGTKHSPAHHAPAKTHDTGTLAYDAGSNTGPGYGSAHGDKRVHQLQQALNRLGLTDSSGKALKDDGKLGPRTTAAVKKAQRALGLTADGKVTPALLAKLTAAKTLPHRAVDPDDVLLRADLYSDMRVHDDGRSYGYEMKEGVTMAAVERRFTTVIVEMRAVDGQARLGGYAAKFNQVSGNLGGFVEVVERSFFNQSRAAGWPNVMCRYNHDDNMLLGTSDARTLLLSVDETGLDYQVVPPSTRADVLELVQRGDVRKSSFAFRLPSDGDEWTMSDQGYPLRKLQQGQLVDVAPVNSPAYVETSVGMRSSMDLRSIDPREVRRLGLGPEAAYESLARRMDADVEEVRAAAEENELRRFFVTVSSGTMPKPKPRTFGAAAMVALMAKKEDPWG